MKTPVEQLFKALENQGYELPLIPKSHYLTMERELFESKDKELSGIKAELHLAKLSLSAAEKELSDFKALVKQMREKQKENGYVWDSAKPSERQVDKIIGL